MSYKLASIIPCPPLNDEVFPFNQSAFVEIIRYQEELVSYSHLPVKTHVLTDSYDFYNFPEI